MKIKASVSVHDTDTVLIIHTAPQHAVQLEKQTLSQAVYSLRHQFSKVFKQVLNSNYKTSPIDFSGTPHMLINRHMLKYLAE